MISDKNWDFFTEDMFSDACKQYRKTYSYKQFKKRYGEISNELFDNCDNNLVSKMNGYLFEFDMLSYRRAKELYLLGIKDAVVLLRKLGVL